MKDADRPEELIPAPSPGSTADEPPPKPESAEPENPAVIRDREIAGKLAQIALVLLVISLFLPWWSVSARELENQGAFFNQHLDNDVFGPVLSTFSLSPFGTKLSFHFRQVLAILLAAVVMNVISLFLVRRHGEFAGLFLVGASSFCGVGLLLFSIFFPAMGYVGRVFWPWGSTHAPSPYGTTLSWVVLPGFLCAVATFFLLLFSARVLNRQRVCEMTPESEPDKTAPPRRRAQRLGRRALVMPVVWVVVAAGAWAGLSYPTRVSMEGLWNDWNWSFKSFEPGDVAILEGKVIETRLYQTSYGPYTVLTMERFAQGNYHGGGTSDGLIVLEGDLRSSYLAGRSASIPIHFRAYHYNGNPFTWADEVFAPLPFIFEMSLITAAISSTAGATILPDGADANGTRLDVLIPNALPLDAFNLTLVRGGLPYYGESAAFTDIPPTDVADSMDSLTRGTSRNGMMKFIDSNTNGALDWGDEFDLNLMPTADATHIDTYVLILNGPLLGFAYIAVRERGPFLLYVQESESIGFQKVSLRMPQDVVSGGNCSSRVQVFGKIGKSEPTSTYEGSLFAENGVLLARFPADTTAFAIAGGASVGFQDGGTQGLLDNGDEWVFENLTTNTRYSLELDDDSQSIVGRIVWTCGIGAAIARFPKVSLSPLVVDPSDPSRLLTNVTSVQWVPDALTSDYRILLRKNESAILPASGSPAYVAANQYPPPGTDTLPLGPSADGAGTWLSFVDTDRNGYLGAGDQFVVNNTAEQSRYELGLYFSYTNILLTTLEWIT